MLPRVLAACAWMAGGIGFRAAGTEPVPQHVRTFLENHCTDCHDGSTKKGNVDLEWSQMDWASAPSTQLLERVHRVLEKGEMPPPKKDRPPISEIHQTLQWIDHGLTRKVPPAATGFRRLTRAEYQSTIQRCFLGNFQLPVGFPEDTRSHGFENLAESLVLSPPLMEAYSESAAWVADGIFRLPRLAVSSRKPIPMLEMSVEERDFGGPTTLLRDGVMRFALEKGRSAPTSFAAPVSGIYRLHLKAAAVHPEPNHAPALKVLSGGTHRVIPIDSTQPGDFVADVPIFEGQTLTFELMDAPRRYLTRGNLKQSRSELRQQFEQDPRLLAAWMSFHEEVTDKSGMVTLQLRESARPQGPKTDEVVQAQYLADSVQKMLEEGTVEVTAVRPDTLERLLDYMVNSGRSWWYAVGLNRHAFENSPAVDLFALTLEGPLQTVEDPESLVAQKTRLALVGNPPGEPGSPPWLEHCVELILKSAFRRPPTPGEKNAYRDVAREHISGGHSPEQALNVVLRSALVSPNFLYRETHSSTGLSLHQLANRLSYFLNLIPADAPLRKAAEDGSLGTPEVVRAQAERLLGTPLVGKFAKSFAGQWLGTRLLPQINPAPHLGTFDNRHLEGFTKEVELFFSEMITANRPLTDFIDPDFTFTNAIVGKEMYGLSLPKPAEGATDLTMVRVSLPRGGRRGGLLGMAGTMMATANGVDTHPVIRGKWLLENILGDPPPPPPPSVPAITPDTRGSKTIRDLMAAHTREESCAGCHRKLDPPGFLLENFDALGKWRDHYPIYTAGSDGKTVAKNGPAIEASAVFPDGTALRDVSDLKRYLVEHVDSFAACVAEKLFLYGTGRVPNYAERKHLRQAADRILAQQGGFRDLLLAVVELEEFRSR